MVDKERNGRRWIDKLLTWSIMLVGALSAILWGVVWGNVSSNTMKIQCLEKGQAVTQEKLSNIMKVLDRIEKKVE